MLQTAASKVGCAKEVSVKWSEKKMAAKIAGRIMPDTYFVLVKRFPLTHIRDEPHLDAAQEIIDWLVEQNLDEGEQEYLDGLTDLVEIYEDQHHPIPEATEADVLRELMRSCGFSQAK